MSVRVFTPSIMAQHKETLTRFTQSSLEVAKLLKEGAALSSEEFLAIETNLLVVQLALAYREVSHRKSSLPGS
jgi:hypothetical protein